MRLEGIVNKERERALNVDPKAYVMKNKPDGSSQAKIQEAEKVIFPQPYENAQSYYDKNQFNKYCEAEHEGGCRHGNNNNNISSMFDVKSLLPMLMGGKFNNVLKPLMSLLSGCGKNENLNIAKIFDIFNTKTKKNESPKDEVEVSKFDDFVIIED